MYPAKWYRYLTTHFGLKGSNDIYQVCQLKIECGALDANEARCQAAHRYCHKSYYIFNTTTDFGFSAVIISCSYIANLSLKNDISISL